MKPTGRLIVALSLAAATVTLAAQQPSAAESLFQRGLLLERAEGSLTQAVVLYERVVAEYPKDTVVVPRALFHLARVYEQTDAQRANRMWTRLATEFGTTSYADEARRKLAVIQAQEAGPFRMRSLDPALGNLYVDGDPFPFRLSPNARIAAHIRNEDAGDKLFLRDVDSGRDRLAVSESLGLRNHLWSPDGQRLAFLAIDRRNRSVPPDLVSGLPTPVDVRVLTVSTGQVKVLAKALPGFANYSWSPDSLRIAVHFGKGNQNAAETLQAINVVSGESKQATGNSLVGIAWSPDGREIAYRATNAQRVDEFRIVSAETGQVRPLPMPLTVTEATRVNLNQTYGGGPFVQDAWATPDRISVVQREQAGSSYYLIPPNGGSARKTCGSSSQRVCGVLTPDSTLQVAEDRNTHRLMLLDLVRGGERRASGAFGDERSPMLSADGKLLAFLSNPNGKWALYVVPIDKTPVAAPIRLAVFEERPDAAWARAWNRDGRLVVRTSYSDYDVYRVNVDKSGRATGPAGRLTQDSAYAYSPSVSPDSTRIAYRYENGDKKGVAVMTADGAGEHPVSEGPLLSPKSWLSAEEVTFIKRAEGGRPNAVGAINIKTGASRTVAEFGTAPAFDYQYVPTRDEIIYWEGAEILYWQGVNMPSRTLRARSLKDGSERTVATIEAPSGFVGFRVSPDGRQIAYGRIIQAGEVRRPEMHVMTIDGRNDRVLTTSPSTGGWNSMGYPNDWSPDGRFLLYDEFPGALRVVDAASGQSWPIADVTDGDNQVWKHGQWAPDGSYIVISRNGFHNEYRSFEGVTYEAVVKLMNAGGKK